MALKGQAVYAKEKHMNYKAQFVIEVLGRKADCKLKASVERIQDSSDRKRILIRFDFKLICRFVRVISSSYQDGIPIPATVLLFPCSFVDRCTIVKSIGKPVTHNARQHIYGAWMKDPLGIMGTETIFVLEYYEGKNVVEEFENMDMFKAGVTRKTYILPYNWDGTGAVVYGPYLYYNRENYGYIVKYNLQTERVETTITVSGLYTGRKYTYQWGGYSGMDLAVDEQGLWVLFASEGNYGRLVASKIDVYKNVVTRTWNLNTETMSAMGNAFVACGVIYCINNPYSRLTTINFAYDTKTGKQWNPNIQFTNQYTYNSMVDYNPREKVLYAWDRMRQVTYPITFEEQQ
ncbi:hypothetical protein ACROYT_G021571 [Oculina patagonica]